MREKPLIKESSQNGSNRVFPQEISGKFLGLFYDPNWPPHELWEWASRTRCITDLSLLDGVETKLLSTMGRGGGPTRSLFIGWGHWGEGEEAGRLRQPQTVHTRHRQSPAIASGFRRRPNYALDKLPRTCLWQALHVPRGGWSRGGSPGSAYYARHL